MANGPFVLFSRGLEGIYRHNHVFRCLQTQFAVVRVDDFSLL